MRFAAGDGLPRTTRSDDRSLGAFAAGEDVSLNSGAAGAGRLRWEVPIVPPRALAGRPEPFPAGRPPDVRPPPARSEPDLGPAGFADRVDGPWPRGLGGPCAPVPLRPNVPPASPNAATRRGFPVPERGGGFPVPDRDAPAFPPTRTRTRTPTAPRTASRRAIPPALERSSRPRPARLISTGTPIHHTTK